MKQLTSSMQVKLNEHLKQAWGRTEWIGLFKLKKEGLRENEVTVLRMKFYCKEEGDLFVCSVWSGENLK